MIADTESVDDLLFDEPLINDIDEFHLPHIEENTYRHVRHNPKPIERIRQLHCHYVDLNKVRESGRDYLFF